VLIDEIGQVLTISSEFFFKTAFKVETSNITSVWSSVNQLYFTTLTTIGLFKPFMKQSEDIWCEGGIT